MGWFDRQLSGREPEDLEDELGRFVRASGVDRALTTICGPFGVRRFVIRFEQRGDVVTLTDLETHPLPMGGGPPDPRGAEEGIQPLEAAINRLHRNMSTSLPWTRGAVAVIRDALDQLEIMPLFDDDADDAALADLGLPEGPGHPLEGHAYRESTPRQLDGLGDNRRRSDPCSRAGDGLDQAQDESARHISPKQQSLCVGDGGSALR